MITEIPGSTQLTSGGDALGKVSSGNSTTTLLTAAADFTGAWEDVSQYDSVVIAVATDQDGGYVVQFSPDGVNIDSSLSRSYRTAKINAPHRFTITRQYCRVVFTNSSASDQTYLRLQTAYGLKNDLNAPLDSLLAQDFDATVVRPSDFKYEVAESKRQGVRTWNKWGYNSDIDTAAAETVWSVGGSFVPMTSAATLDVTSSDANDTAAGTGAQSIILYGIDANYEYQIEVVTMNGATSVTTSNTWLGINRAALYLSGSGGTNAGIITIDTTAGGVVQAEIPAGGGSTQQAFFFVEASSNFLIDWLFLNYVKTSGHTFVTTRMYVTSLVSGSKYEAFRHITDTSISNTTELNPSQPFVVGEKSLVEFIVETDHDNTAASVRFSGIVSKISGA